MCICRNTLGQKQSNQAGKEEKWIRGEDWGAYQYATKYIYKKYIYCVYNSYYIPTVPKIHLPALTPELCVQKPSEKEYNEIAKLPGDKRHINRQKNGNTYK